MPMYPFSLEQDDPGFHQQMCTACWECSLVPVYDGVEMYCIAMNVLGGTDPPWDQFMDTQTL